MCSMIFKASMALILSNSCFLYPVEQTANGAKFVYKVFLQDWKRILYVPPRFEFIWPNQPVSRDRDKEEGREKRRTGKTIHL